VIRTGFLNSLADLHVIAGLYDDAERLVDREIGEAKRFRLEFVMPNALFNLAGARLGQGQYTSAWTLVDRAGAEKQTDAFLRANAHGIRIRIALSRRDSSAVRRLLFDFTETGLRGDIVGEVFACIGLAEAIFGSTPRACNLVARAKERSTLVTTRVLTAAVESILALDANSDHCSKLLDDLASVATQTGAIDSVVVALRASPRLLDASSKHERLRPVARLAARRSQDPTLAAATGIALDRKPVPSELSPREHEVLALVAEGFRNDEVAQRLFISPKTVKAHLQHIYEKLEVRSRTEAVTRAREARLLS
jgi:ATP/maltotriose-dependent transcriptional regulator MalT